MIYFLCFSNVHYLLHTAQYYTQYKKIIKIKNYHTFLKTSKFQQQKL